MFVEKENKQKKDGGMAKSVYKKLSPEKKVLQDLVDEEYSDFVADLQKHIRDEKFQAFLQMGLEQFDGDAEDDKVKVKPDNIPVKNLVPTQSQIGLADSLGYLSLFWLSLVSFTPLMRQSGNGERNPTVRRWKLPS